MPFPGTQVIPDGWSRSHAPVAAGGMKATVEIRDPADATSTWDPATESQTSTPGPARYADSARVQQLTGSDVQQTGQTVGQHTYLVQLPMGAEPVEEGWTVTVTDAINDADLVAWTATRPMVITDVQHGSERFTRDLICTLNLD